MKPSQLKPGDKVRCGGREMTFIRRERRWEVQGTSLNYFRCEAYRGLRGPNDDGTCTMTNAYAARHCERVEAAA